VLSAAQIDSCSYILSGSVIDEHDQSPLDFATVYIIELSKGVVAGEGGNFHIEDLCAGTYTVVVSHVSCQPDTSLVAINQNTKLNLYLEHHTEALKQITITGQELETALNSDQEQVVGIGTLDRYTHKNLGDVLTEIPGVTSFKTGNQMVKPVVQGLFGSRIITINQGVRMQDMEWGDEHGVMIDINAAGSVNLTRGGSALRFGGDAVAGLIQVESARIPKDTLMGRTRVGGSNNGWGGSITSELALSGKTGWYTKIQGTLKRFGDFRAPDYQLTNTGVYDKGAFLTVGRYTKKGGFEAYYSIYDTKVGILSASHIGNIGDLADAINSQEPRIIEDFSYDIGLPRQEVTHQLSRFKYDHQLTIGTLQLQYDFQSNHRFEFDKRVGDDRDKPSIDLKLTTHTLSGNLLFNQKGALPLEAGLMYRYQKNFANPDTGVRRLIPDYDKYEVGAYLNGLYQLSEDASLDAGVRYDFNRIDALKYYKKSRWEERGYQEDFSHIIVQEFPTQLLTNPIFNYHNFTYTLGLNYQLDPRKELSFNYAFTQRAPNPSELFSEGLHHGAARIELGDLRINPEKSHKLGFNMHGQNKHYNWDVMPYVNFVNNFILLEPEGVEQTIRGAFPVWEYYQTDAFLWGIDGQLTANWNTQWSSNHSGRYVYGQDQAGNRPLINIPAPQIRNRLIFNEMDWNSLEVTLESIYTFKQNRFPDNNFLVFIPETDSFEELDVSTPPGGYHLLNLHASIDIIPGNKNSLQVGFSVNNITNTRYRDYLNRLRFFADELGRSFEFSFAFNY
jgi:iron complex outermembrane receptor protein